jgi:CubicO group peptidase (beta-lactamase class C family)
MPLPPSVLPRFFATLLLGGVFFSGTAHGAPLDEMATAIEHDLAGRCVGFGYAIFQNGNFARGGGGGSAKLGDPENQFDFGIPFDEDTVKDAHSMSKTITAVALVLALEANPSVDLGSAIFPFLPADLQNVVPAASAVRNITFQNLLAHRSGFSASSSFSWAQIRTQLQGGLPNPIGQYEYANWNYAVCRLLIPYIVNQNFYRSLEQNLSGQPDGGVAQIDQATSNFYINWVRNQVFEPAGITATIHPRPVASTLDNFAWYYDASDRAVPAQIMPDRRLTVGSGGWALSAKDFARFIAALFRGEILTAGQLQDLQDNDLGMFDRTGINGSDVYFSHNGATSSAVGGRSTWMYFPNDIAVAVQVNSLNNQYSAIGLDLSRTVQEAWENAFGSVPARSVNYQRHLFFSRGEDGWITSIGVRDSGTLGARNFDYDFFKNDAPAGFDQHVFFGVGSQAFLLRYNSRNFIGQGSATMHRINADGTLGAEVFASENWLADWDHLRIFTTFNGTFLLLHNADSGRVRTVPISAQGNVLSAVSDLDLTSGFDVGEIITLNGQHQFIRYNSTSGEIVARSLGADGAVGGIVYSSTWSAGFPDWEIYEAGGNDFIFRYNRNDGAARIHRVNGSLADTTSVLDQTWSAGWSVLRFFEIGSQTFFVRYNAATGAARMQEIDSDGTPGDVVFQSTWLMPKTSTGVFDPARGGWSDLQVYDATPGFSGPVQDLANYPFQATIELGSLVQGTLELPDVSEAVLVLPRPSVRQIRGEVALSWTSSPKALYILEETLDFQRWIVRGTYPGDGLDLSTMVERDPASGAMPDSIFFRLHTIEAIPPLPPSDPTAGGP